jgi:hypothetical protein
LQINITATCQRLANLFTESSATTSPSSFGGNHTKNLLLKELKRDHTATGSRSSYRWAVAATEAGNLELQLQVLPIPLPSIEARQQIVDNNAAVTVIQQWDIATLHLQRRRRTQQACAHSQSNWRS